MSLLVVGSIALDTVKTPVEEHGDLLGGSASYAAAAASYFSPVQLVGVVGSDFPQAEFDFWRSRKIDSAGVQRVEGETFRWSGEYSWDLNTRETRSVALNVFENFQPELPKSYRQTDFALLANIAPALQSHVLKQMEKPRFVVADTMDLWIETTRADLDALLPHVDLLILNDSEAREMTKETFTDLRKAMIYGSVLASFCVEAFSLERLRNLTMDEINERYETFKLMSQFEVPET